MPLISSEKTRVPRAFFSWHFRQENIRFFVRLMPLVLFLLPCKLLSQDTARVVPDGTEGVLYVVPPPDSAAKNLPANEFNGRFTTIKLGMGFIYDGVAYKQSDEFKRQM